MGLGAVRSPRCTACPLAAERWVADSLRRGLLASRLALGLAWPGLAGLALPSQLIRTGDWRSLMNSQEPVKLSQSYKSYKT